jgi:hypothetical protein
MGRERDRRKGNDDFGKKSEKEHRGDEKRQTPPQRPGERDPHHRHAPGRGQDVPPVHPEQRGQDDRRQGAE